MLSEAAAAFEALCGQQTFELIIFPLILKTT
jgi:hypothetical protein